MGGDEYELYEALESLTLNFYKKDTITNTIEETVTENIVKTSIDTGSDTGSNSGSDTGSDTGSNSGSNSGSDTGADSGSDTGSDTGSDSENMSILKNVNNCNYIDGSSFNVEELYNLGNKYCHKIKPANEFEQFIEFYVSQKNQTILTGDVKYPIMFVKKGDYILTDKEGLIHNISKNKFHEIYHIVKPSFNQWIMKYDWNILFAFGIIMFCINSVFNTWYTIMPMFCVLVFDYLRFIYEKIICCY